MTLPGRSVSASDLLYGLLDGEDVRVEEVVRGVEGLSFGCRDLGGLPVFANRHVDDVRSGHLDRRLPEEGGGDAVGCDLAGERLVVYRGALDFGLASGVERRGLCLRQRRRIVEPGRSSAAGRQRGG